MSEIEISFSMKNPYRAHLNRFFEINIDLWHSARRLNKVLLSDVKKHTSEKAKFFSGTNLAIGDWTGPTNNGWKINLHTGIQKSIYKEDYAFEMERVLSREFGFAFAQCYEAFETLLKDFVYEKIITNEIFRKSLPENKSYARENLKGGNEIFELIKKAGGGRFNKYSKVNNHNIRFKELYKILSEVRHSITHSQARLKTSKIPDDIYYKSLFEHLFPWNKLENDIIYLKFDYDMLKKLLKYMSEFGYQIFKILSEEDEYQWNL